VKCDKCMLYPRNLSLRKQEADHRAVGKTLAYTSIQFTNSKGEIAARGSHTKLVTSVPSEVCSSC